MSIFLTLLIGAAGLGTILGSFLNALLFRFNTGRSVMKGRSRCMHCGHTLEALDLVPILSFIFLRGRCRYCGSKFSWQYPLVEATAALLSVLVFVAHPEPLSYALWLFVWMTLLFIAVYDMRHLIIPYSALAVLLLFSLALLFVPCILTAGCELTIFSYLSGPLLALPLFLISLISMGRWMGWADSALELALGWLLGLGMGLTALMLAFWSGAIVGLLLMTLFKRVTMNSEVPFAPFLILGAGLALFFNVNFFSSISWPLW